MQTSSDGGRRLSKTEASRCFTPQIWKSRYVWTSQACTYIAGCFISGVEATRSFCLWQVYATFACQFLFQANECWCMIKSVFETCLHELSGNGNPGQAKILPEFMYSLQLHSGLRSHSRPKNLEREKAVDQLNTQQLLTSSSIAFAISVASYWLRLILPTSDFASSGKRMSGSEMWQCPLNLQDCVSFTYPGELWRFYWPQPIDSCRCDGSAPLARSAGFNADPIQCCGWFRQGRWSHILRSHSATGGAWITYRSLLAQAMFAIESQALGSRTQITDRYFILFPTSLLLKSRRYWAPQKPGCVLSRSQQS